MSTTFAEHLDALADWRRALRTQVLALSELLAEHELLDASGAEVLASLSRKLAADRVVLACVAEVSRGKSELLNAIFFADAGRRVLPATPGRTTMCPVELQFHADQAPELALLPIDTRLGGQPLADLRLRPEAWERVPLDPGDPDALVQSLQRVTQTRRVSAVVAAKLGLWSDERPHDNPPRQADGQVEVPAWRHALINYPHPLLQRGLIVVDTPGLNAVGAEPELTLGLLPGVHAVVFLLAADTGVSRSDLEVWTGHLDGESLERFVVLNKTDILADPLSSPEAVARQLDEQLRQIAGLLQMPRERVYALSARDALAARINGDAAGLARSGLPAFEAALGSELLPRQRALLARSTQAALRTVREQAARRLLQRRRQNAEQMLELRSLRGKSAAKVRSLLQRLQAEMGEFERCTTRLSALRAVHLRMLHQAQSALASEVLREQLTVMRGAIAAMPLKLGAAGAFRKLCLHLRAALGAAREQSDEIQKMLGGSYQQLNAEFGFAFTLADPPGLDRFFGDLGAIERSYGRHLGPLHVWRLSSDTFMDQFQRMLLSKLRMIFEGAAGELELWSRSASTQIELQLRERRVAFGRREEALQRIESAASELESRIAQIEQQDRQLGALQARVDAAVGQVRDRAGDAADPGAAAAPPVPLRSLAY